RRFGQALPCPPPPGVSIRSRSHVAQVRGLEGGDIGLLLPDEKPSAVSSVVWGVAPRISIAVPRTITKVRRRVSAEAPWRFRAPLTSLPAMDRRPGRPRRGCARAPRGPVTNATAETSSSVLPSRTYRIASPLYSGSSADGG